MAPFQSLLLPTTPGRQCGSNPFLPPSLPVYLPTILAPHVAHPPAREANSSVTCPAAPAACLVRGAAAAAQDCRAAKNTPAAAPPARRRIRSGSSGPALGSGIRPGPGKNVITK